MTSWKILGVSLALLCAAGLAHAAGGDASVALLTLLALVLPGIAYVLLDRRLLVPIQELARTAKGIAAGELDPQRTIYTVPALRELSDSVQQMGRALADNEQVAQRQIWVQNRQTMLADVMRGDLSPQELGAIALDFLCEASGAVVATCYGIAQQKLVLISGHGAVSPPLEIQIGEGLVGQVAKSNQLSVLENVPPGYLQLQSSTGRGSPGQVVLVPMEANGATQGVLEFASVQRFSEESIILFREAGPSVAVALASSRARERTEQLLQETQELALKLQATNEDLRGMSRFKSEFLANMSHELRTPLNSILLLTQLLAENQSQNLNPEEVDWVQTIHRSGNNLLELINDILDLSKVEAGKLEFFFRPTAVGDVVSNLERIFRPLAVEKDLAFHVVLADDLPRTLVTDRQRLEQVLRNLLSNAIKFTPQGSVTLQLSTLADALLFNVVDTGIGIAEEKKNIIFEAFAQADGSTQRRFGGTGLGLSIAKEFVQRLGGSLSVSSKVGHGSTFGLQLPTLGILESPQPPEPRIEATAEACAALCAAPAEFVRGRTLLVVDDDARNVFALSAQLKNHGCTIVAAQNGRMALEKLTANPGLDGVLLDMMMPQMDGYQTARMIRELPHFAQLPIIALTAQAMEGAREACLQAGCDDYLPKPINMGHLFSKLETLVGRNS